MAGAEGTHMQQDEMIIASRIILLLIIYSRVCTRRVKTFFVYYLTAKVLSL